MACGGGQAVQCWRPDAVMQKEHQRVCIRKRKHTRPHWESEGFIVPREDTGQHNPVRGKGPCFVQVTKEWRMAGIAMKLSTPENIRTLQRKLCRKAKQEPGYRFYALCDKVCRADILEFAYELVRANKGSPGIDGQTCEAIEAGEGVAAFLAKLEE